MKRHGTFGDVWHAVLGKSKRIVFRNLVAGFLIRECRQSRVAGSTDMQSEAIATNFLVFQRSHMFALLTDSPTIWSAGKPSVSHQLDVLS